MSFLSPILLALGAAVAVPLILHLLQRHQGPRLVFPALRYLRRAERENARQIRLRQLLLMALRLAVIILIALAAARPFLRQSGTGHEPTAVAIVIDNSLSSGLIVGEERILDQLKARALETLAAARAEDRFWIIRAGSPWEPATMLDAAAAAALVRGTEVSAGRADLTAALGRARALLAAGAGDLVPEIHLLSDMQANSFAAEATGWSETDAPPLIAWTPPGSAPENLGIAEVSIDGGVAPRPGERAAIAVKVGGTTSRAETPLRLIVGERVAAAGTAEPGSATILQVTAPSSGLLTGHVEIDPDALRGDDRRYFAARVQPPPAVALAGEPPFIGDALAVLADAGRIRRVRSETPDIVIAPAGLGLEGARANTTSVVFAPSSPTELPAANRRLAEAGIPWRFGAPTGGGESRLAIEGLEDQVLAPLADVRLRDVYELRPEPDAEARVRLRLRDGRAWAIQGGLAGGGSYILIASSLSTDATTLPTSPALIPLLDRLTGSWAATSEGSGEAAPGSRRRLPANATAVIRPDGTRDSVAAGSEYLVPGRPGIYQIAAGGEVVDAFAVNPDPAESDLARLDRRAFTSLLEGWRAEWVTDPGSWSASIYQERLGREIWRPLVLAALAFLLIEGLIAASGSVRGADSGGRRSEGSGVSPERAPVAAS